MNELLILTTWLYLEDLKGMYFPKNSCVHTDECIVDRVWTLVRVFHRFYGYIFCKPLGDNTPLVEIVYEFNGLVNLKYPVTPTIRSIELFLVSIFLFDFSRGRAKDRYRRI